MEFWGAQVKAGKPLTVKPDQYCLIHVSQASLDKGKKGDSALLYVTVDGKKLVIGTLSQENIPRITFDHLVFEIEFELSHSLERGSVHFIGYKSPIIDQDEEEETTEQPEPSNKKRKAKPAATTTPQRTGKSVLEPCSESKANLKKQKIHKEKSEENDEDVKIVSKNEIKEMKKSIKELSEAMKKLQEILLTN